jgi:hypothetical protein
MNLNINHRNSKSVIPSNTSTPMKYQMQQFYQHHATFIHNNKISRDNHNQDSPSCNKATRFLGLRAVSILNKWFNENRDYPYPDETITDLLAKEASE